MPKNLYLLFFAANLMFIVTHLYGWLLKWFYRPEIYGEQFEELFPAHRAVGFIYLLQVLELPYLLQVGDPGALLYANAFALLCFSLQMLVMCENYFFPHTLRRRRDYWIVLPAVAVILPLFLQAVRLVTLPVGYRPWAFAMVSLVFAVYFWLNIRMALRIGRAVRQVNEHTYADPDDFPVRFALYIQWLPVAVCILLAFNFYADAPWVKCVRDVLFVGANVAFCIYTLNPHRKVFTPTEESLIEQMEQPDGVAAYRLSDERLIDLSQRLRQLLEEEHIFIEPHITADMLMQRLGTNANYLSETIKRSGYRSFYDMISRHRVSHAIRLIQSHPDEKLLAIADQCGFSSQTSMVKAFRQQGKSSPSTYKEGK